MEVEKRIELAKLKVITEFSLLAPLSAKLKFVKANFVETAGLDYRNKIIYYNEEFVKSLDNKELTAVIFHEILHYLFIHDLRALKNKEFAIKVNISADAIINYLIRKTVGIDLRFGVNFDDIRMLSKKLRKYSDEELAKMHHIEIAKEIERELENFVSDLINSISNEDMKDEKKLDQKIKEVIDRHYSNASEEFKEALKQSIKEGLKLREQLENLSESDAKKLEKEIRELIEKGKVFAKKRGTEKGLLEEYLEILLKKKQRNWRKLLREMTSEIRTLASDYDFTRPSVKTKIFEEVTGRKTFIPSLEKEDIDINVIIGIDVSGSISDEEYKEFVNEIYNLLSDIREVKGWIVMWEAEVSKVIKIKNGWNKEIFEELKKRKGYGGTVIRSFFEKASELVRNRKRNTYLVILTDGETEKVKKEWVKDWKKVIFLISRGGTKENVRHLENEKNVYVAFLD